MTRAAVIACPTCGALIGGVVAYALHRVGGVDGGLRCATVTEMVANGLQLTDAGHWIAPTSERATA
jgi:hypothetical protein